jgi:hypothetical protein
MHAVPGGSGPRHHSKATRAAMRGLPSLQICGAPVVLQDATHSQQPVSGSWTIFARNAPSVFGDTASNGGGVLSAPRSADDKTDSVSSFTT